MEMKGVCIALSSLLLILLSLLSECHGEKKSSTMPYSNSELYITTTTQDYQPFTSEVITSMFVSAYLTSNSGEITTSILLSYYITPSYTITPSMPGETVALLTPGQLTVATSNTHIQPSSASLYITSPIATSSMQTTLGHSVATSSMQTTLGHSVATSNTHIQASITPHSSPSIQTIPGETVATSLIQSSSLPNTSPIATPSLQLGHSVATSNTRIQPSISLHSITTPIITPSIQTIPGETVATSISVQPTLATSNTLIQPSITNTTSPIATQSSATTALINTPPISGTQIVTSSASIHVSPSSSAPYESTSSSTRPTANTPNTMTAGSSQLEHVPTSTSPPSSSNSFIATTQIPTSTGTPDTGDGDDSISDKIESFFKNDVMIGRTYVLIAFVLSPVIIILCIVVSCLGCCWLRSCRRKNRKNFDLTGNQVSTTRNGVSPTYRPRSRASVHELRTLDTDAFYGEYHYQTASQPYHNTVTTAADNSFYDPLPTISPLSYPSQLKNYISSPDRRDQLSSPTPHISLSGSPGKIRRFPGSSPSLHRPTPLGQQLQKQAEKNSTQGSRNSIQGSRASISAMGSRASFTGSRNSFLSSNNAMSRDDMRSSGFLLASNKTMSEEETSSQISYRPLVRQTSLDMVPTRESPVQPSSQMTSKKRGYESSSLTCISNPLALQGEEEAVGREDGDGVDENDLRTDPLNPVMTSTPVNQGTEDLPTKEARLNKKMEVSGDSSVFMSPRKKSLKQLTSLTLSETEEREAPENTSETTPTTSEVVGGDEANKESSTQKTEKPRNKPMSRLEKLTSLDYLRSSIRRSLKKKRVSFLTRTPDTTPKIKKKSPSRTLPAEEPELEPDLTFTNQEAFDSEGPMISPRIHTPSPLSPEFETVDEYPQRYPNDFFNSDVYPETLFHPHPRTGGGASGGGRVRAYSDMPMFAPQLSQPTYYPSTMHYPQPTYPQLSQQYIPAPYPPIFGSPPQQNAIFGSPPNQGPIFGSPPNQSAIFGSPPHQGNIFGSPSHRSYGPLTAPQPSMHPGLHPHGRRYTDSVTGSSTGGARTGRGRGGGDRSAGDRRRLRQTKSPDRYTDTTSNVSSRYDPGVSPDRFTETSNISDIRAHSPDVYSGLVQGHDGYLDSQFRFRSIPTSPEERRGGGDGGPMYSGEWPSHRTAPHYSERSIDNPQKGSGSYRPPSGHNSQVQSPAHQPYHGRYRRTSIDRSPNEATASHRNRRSSIENQPLPSHSRRSSIDNQQGNHSRRSSIDGGQTSGPGAGRHTSIDSYSGGQHGPGFQPRQHRNGMEMDEAWQHSQRDEPPMQYGMGSQHGRKGVWSDKTDTTRGPDSMERAVDSGSGTAKAKVSWNNEIIEHVRTPSDSSEHYDNL